MDDEAPAFVDTNVLVYAFDSTDPTRHRVAAQLLSRRLGATLLVNPGDTLELVI